MVATKPMLKRLLSGPIFILLAFIILLNCKTADAEDYVKLQGYGHSFSNGIAVASGVFALNKDFNLKTSGYFKYTVDVISSGSGLSAISGASTADTGAGVEDTRNELTVGLSHIFGGGVTVDVYYDYSEEDDFISHTPTISVKKELFNKNTTLSFGYSRNSDTVSGIFIGMDKDRDTNNFFLGITQILSPVTLVYAGYSRSDQNGFMSEGIRLVPVNGQIASNCINEAVANCVDESFPNSRSRNSYMAGLHHYFKDGALERSSVRLKFRYYDDDWDISSYTIEGEFYKYLSDANLVRFNYRYYDQSSADFYNKAYSGAATELYRTASPQHKGLQTHLVGAKLTHKLKMLNDGNIEGKYEYYTESTNTDAHIFMLGAKILF